MTESIRIVQINEVSEFGSTGRSTKEISNYLSENGIENSIVYSKGSPIGESYQIGSRFGKKIHSLLSRITGLQGYFSSFSTRKLIRYLKEYSPDVVQIGNIHGNFINIKILYKYLADNEIATVLVLHDCWNFTGNRVHYTVDNEYTWKGIKNGKTKKTSGNISWFFDRENKMLKDKYNLYKNINNLNVIGVSNWITNESKNSILGKSNSIRSIYNWIDLDVFKPRHSDVLPLRKMIENKFVILGVATNFNDNKGLSTFLELSNHIKDNMVIVLIGYISKDTYLPPNIIHVPLVDDPIELAEYYSLASVFVNLSIEESFGKVSAEALACGTPVITNMHTANPEIIGDNCGYILKSMHVSEIIKTIERVELNGKQYYSARSRSHAVENYDMNKILPEYLKLYYELLER